jgi:hypothetical protein
MDIGESLVAAYVRQVRRRQHGRIQQAARSKSLIGLSNICPMPPQLF